jgi:hypothetical protein
MLDQLPDFGCDAGRRPEDGIPHLIIAAASVEPHPVAPCTRTHIWLLPITASRRVVRHRMHLTRTEGFFCFASLAMYSMIVEYPDPRCPAWVFPRESNLLQTFFTVVVSVLVSITVISTIVAIIFFHYSYICYNIHYVYCH